MEYVWWRFSTRLFWLPAQGLRQLSRPASDQAVDSSITHNFTICLEDFHEEFSYLFSTLLAVKCIPLHVSYILYALTSRGRLFWPGCNMIVARSQSIFNFNIFARSEFRSKPRTTLAVATISTFWENYAFTSIFLDASSMNREGSIFRMTWSDSSTILIPWTDS